MCMHTMKLSLILLFASSSMFLQGTLGEIICEKLPKEVCAFSVASSGKRCLLENWGDGKDVDYQCKTSSVTVDRVSGYIETDDCIKACGIDRFSLGISSDILLHPKSASKLCSPLCYQNCPNIVDLYFNLAMGEGVYLPELCEKQKENPHRSISELLSGSNEGGPASSFVGEPVSSLAGGPVSSLAGGPVSSSASADGPSSSAAPTSADGPSSSTKSEDESGSSPTKSEDKYDSSDSKSEDKSDSSPSKSKSEDESDSDSEDE